MATRVLYKQGTKATYLSLPVRLPNALYWCEDTRELFKGDNLYTDGVRRVKTFLKLPPLAEAAESVLYICEDTGCGYVLKENRVGWDIVIHGVDHQTIDYNEDGCLRLKSVPAGVIGGLEDQVAEITGRELETFGAQKIGNIDGTVKDYVDKQISGVATSEAMNALGQRVTDAEANITSLEKQIGGKSIGAQIDEKITELDLANTYEPKGAADAKDADIAAAKKAGTDAQADVDVLKAKVGAVPADKTVVKMIEEAQTAATYDDAAVKADIKKNADAIGVLNGSGEGSVDKKITDAINDFAMKVSDDGVINSYKELIDWVATHGSEAAKMTGEITKLQAILNGIGGECESATVVAYVTEAINALKIGDYAKAADLTALAGRVSTAEASVTTLTGDGVGSVKKAQADAEAHADTVAGTAETNAKKHATDLNTAMDTRVKKVEASVTTMTGEGEGSVKKALADAKAYADGLATNYDKAGDAAKALTDAKVYSDGLAKNYDKSGAATRALADAKTYSDGLAQNYDKSGAATQALADAKVYADGLAGNYDTKGSAAQALTDAKSYTDTKLKDIPAPDVSGQISTHNKDASAHQDIRAELGKKEAAGAAAAVQKKVDEHTGDASVHVTAEEKAKLNSVASKPKACLVTLNPGDWDAEAKTQDAVVANVVADESAQMIHPMPKVGQLAAYNKAGIQMVAQGEGKVTFMCDAIPTKKVDVWVVTEDVEDVTP